ncbi:MAG: helical backbone metal receptor [Elusimicrobia bacterium]|nr:helical backbone metal receptor [Candidatus Liberimonas magnetica]
MKKILFIILLFYPLLCFGKGYERIVSLAPSVTKNLYLLGMENKVIGITVYCPEGDIKKEKIGTLLEPNIEKIVSLAPDLVIASKEGNINNSVTRLKELGIETYIMGPCNNFNDICSGFLSLAKFLGNEDKANGIIMEAKIRIEKVKNKVKEKKKVSVFWEVGANPLFTISRKSFVNEFIEMAGGKNIFDEIKIRYPQISREEVLHRDPDVIIIAAMGENLEKEKKYWQNFKTLKASNSGKIYTLGDTIFTDPTPEAFVRGVESVANILYNVGLEDNIKNEK